MIILFFSFLSRQHMTNMFSFVGSFNPLLLSIDKVRKNMIIIRVFVHSKINPYNQVFSN